MIPLGLLTLYLLFAAFSIVYAAILDPSNLGQFVLSFRYDLPRMLAVLVLPIIAEVILFNGIAEGYTCRYKANNLEFIIYRKGQGILNLLYKDAVSVEYKPMRFLWVRQGVHVIIKMKNYSLDFDYVVSPRKYLDRPEEYPFEIIRKKLEELQNNLPNKNGGLEQLDLLGKGIVYRAYSKRTTALMMIPFVLLGAYLVFMTAVVVDVIIKEPILFAESILFGLPQIILYIVLPLALEILWFRVMKSGYPCEYKATRVDFSVTRKGDTVMRIPYEEAESVEYAPMKFLRVEQGFHVKIKTKSGAHDFDYVVPKAMRFHQENFPFYIISEEIVRRKIENETGEQDADQ